MINLLLARAAARRRELAMRAALGATRGRLIRESLAESAAIGILGGAAGVGAAYALLRLFLAIAPGGLTGLERARIDLRVLLFALVASLVSALLSGVAPALQRPRAEALMAWRDVGSPSAVFRHVLVVVQVSLSLVLLAGASLFARSPVKIETQDLGFRPDRSSRLLSLCGAASTMILARRPLSIATWSSGSEVSPARTRSPWPIPFLR
ncbi:MAG TPA: FtsX-like permease family protein, partial [Bryobacteraceae bacterium]|nr:FtsX-like permease family protein [Bryobacteraceae bacterium]